MCGLDPAGVAHHSTHHADRGMARKAPDWAPVPMCHTCHSSFHARTWGPFKGWSKARANEWQDRMVEVYRSSDGDERNPLAPL